MCEVLALWRLTVWAWSREYILDLENFATASRRYTVAINKLVDGQLVDNTYDGRARHG